MNAEQYTYEQRDGTTVIHNQKGGQFTFLGTTVDELTQSMQNAANAIERHQRHLRMLHAVVQDMRPEAVAYPSIHTAKRK